MPGPAAAVIAVSPVQQGLLERLAQRQTAPQRLVRRAQVILALALNPCIDAVARQLGLTRVSIRLWRDRWLQATDALGRAEQEQASEAALLDLIEQALADAPRPGCPATFGPEQIVGIVAVACEPPSQSGRPISHWTARELADEAAKRQLVKRISPRTVGRFLKRGRATAAPKPLLAQQQPG
jgi:putative transposase